MQKASVLLILYLISLFGYSLTRGFYAYQPFLVLFFNFIIFWFLLFSKNRTLTLVNKFNFEQVVLVVFLVNNLLYVLLFGGIYLITDTATTIIKFLLPLILILSAIYLFDFGKVQSRVLKLNFSALILLGILGRILILIASPAPKIDVYDMLKYGPTYFLKGKNPYSEMYPQRYQGVVPNYYTYFPLSLPIFLPADFLFRDPRVTYLVSDLVVAFLLFKILDKARTKLGYSKYLLPLIFFYHPSGSFILEQSWMEPLILMILVVFVYMEIFLKNLRRFSFLMLGLFLGVKQSMLILLPFFVFFSQVRKSTIFKSLALVFISVLPFLIWSYRDFYNDTVKFFIVLPPRYDSLVLNSFTHDIFGKDLPKQLMYLLWLIVFGISFTKKFTTWSKFITVLSFLLFGFYIFNKQAFIHYYYFVSGLFLLAAILSVWEERSLSID